MLEFLPARQSSKLGLCFLCRALILERPSSDEADWASPRGVARSTAAVVLLESAQKICGHPCVQRLVRAAQRVQEPTSRVHTSKHHQEPATLVPNRLLPRRSPRLCRGSFRLGVFASLYGSNVIVSQLPPGRKLPSSLLLGATRGVRRCVPTIVPTSYVNQWHLVLYFYSYCQFEVDVDRDAASLCRGQQASFIMRPYLETL